MHCNLWVLPHIQLTSGKNWAPDVETGRLFTQTSYLGPFMSLSPFIEDNVCQVAGGSLIFVYSYMYNCGDCVWYKGNPSFWWYNVYTHYLLFCTQKELSSQYSGNKLEEIMATGDGLLRVMDSAEVS